MKADDPPRTIIDDDIMQGVALFADSPSRPALKRSDVCSPAHGSPSDSLSPEFKRPNLQVSPASRAMHANVNHNSKSTNASAKRRWSKQEDEKLCAAVKTFGLSDWKMIAEVYMAGHELSDAQCMHRWQKVLRPGLVKGAFCEKEDKVIVDCLREGGLKRRWTKQEDEKLCLAVKAVGPHDWKQIAEVHLAGHGRSDMQCLHRWQKVLRAGLVKGAFTEDEDRIIIGCMREGGLTWMQIAERIPGRIGKQCRERWTNHLDPNLKKGGWTHEEDTILAEAQQRWGNAWTKIAKLLPGRAENAVKNRWNSAFRRKKSAMFGKAAPAENTLRDTAAIARARVAMEIIDRDEKEPEASTKTRATKRCPSITSAEASILFAARTAPSSTSLPPPSPSEALELFSGFGKEQAEYGDSLLSLDGVDVEGEAMEDCELDVSFDALEVAGVEPVDLTGHTQLSELGGEHSLKLDPRTLSPFARSTGTSTPSVDNKDEDIFFRGSHCSRTGLTPSGPMVKTPAGMLQGLSPLHNARSSRHPGSERLFPVSEMESAMPHDVNDLSITLPTLNTLPASDRSGEFPVDRAIKIAQCEFISPNSQDYHAAWGLPAPEVKLPLNVTALLLNNINIDNSVNNGVSSTTVLGGGAPTFSNAVA